MIRFDDRVAVVTGAGTGLGREHAMLLASRGARVVVNDIGASLAGDGGSGGPADAVVHAIRAAGGEAVANNDSVAEPASAARIIEAAMSAWGRVDILVNNAGILRESRLDEMAIDAIDKVLAVHLMGSLYCTRAALAPMRRQGHGRIVFTSSGSGLLGFRMQSIYGAAKAAMVGLMNCLRFELEGSGVTVNTVVPSADTRMSQGLVDAALQRHMKPALIAPLVAWLASDACTGSGHVLNSFGGLNFKVALYRNQGMQFDPAEPLTPEMIEAQWQRIVDMDSVEPYRGTVASLAPNLRSIGRM